MNELNLAVGQIWRHHNGERVRIALLGIDEKSGLPAVAYQSMADGQVWFKRADEFVHETVWVGGAYVNRFERSEEVKL